MLRRNRILALACLVTLFASSSALGGKPPKPVKPPDWEVKCAVAEFNQGSIWSDPASFERVGEAKYEAVFDATMGWSLGTPDDTFREKQDACQWASESPFPWTSGIDRFVFYYVRGDTVVRWAFDAYVDDDPDIERVKFYCRTDSFVPADGDDPFAEGGTISCNTVDVRMERIDNVITQCLWDFTDGFPAPPTFHISNVAPGSCP